MKKIRCRPEGGSGEIDAEKKTNPRLSRQLNSANSEQLKLARLRDRVKRGKT